MNVEFHFAALRTTKAFESSEKALRVCFTDATQRSEILFTRHNMERRKENNKTNFATFLFAFSLRSVLFSLVFVCFVAFSVVLFSVAEQNARQNTMRKFFLSYFAFCGDPKHFHVPVIPP